jgi:hypothetical protein
MMMNNEAIRILPISDHSVKLDYDALNQQHMRNSEELWTAIEASRWSSSNDESVAF